jgi:hypothetical protein
MVHNDVAYYGSFRVGRVKAFDRFFANPQCLMVLSSPAKQFRERYLHHYVQQVGVQPDLFKWLNERGMGLYLEDNKSHKEYHSPPNRFYEMLSAGLPMVFEEAAGPTLRKAGYDPSEFTVSKPLDVARKLKERDAIGKAQYERWWDKALAERHDLVKKINTAWDKLYQERHMIHQEA